MAQVVADTFTGQWPNGILATVVTECVSKSIEAAGAVQYLVAHSPELPTKLSKHLGGVIEPLATGSTKVWHGNTHSTPTASVVVISTKRRFSPPTGNP